MKNIVVLTGAGMSAESGIHTFRDQGDSGITDLLTIIGTSMVVYPAASLVNYARHGTPIYYIDPQPSPIHWLKNVTVIPQKAGDGVPSLVKELLENK